MIEVTILVADEHVGAIDVLAVALEDAGLRLDAALPATGVICGAVEDEAALRSVAAVDGVAAVERAREVGVPPPDEPVQ